MGLRSEDELLQVVRNHEEGMEWPIYAEPVNMCSHDQRRTRQLMPEGLG